MACFPTPPLFDATARGNPLEFLDETYSAKTREIELPYGENNSRFAAHHYSLTQPTHIDMIVDDVSKAEMLSNYFASVFTARCTLVQSAVLRSHVVCLSVCDVGEL